MAKDLSLLVKSSRVAIPRSSNFQRFVTPCLADAISTDLDVFLKPNLIGLFFRGTMFR
jgi:hypothetical protein